MQTRNLRMWTFGLITLSSLAGPVAFADSKLPVYECAVLDSEHCNPVAEFIFDTAKPAEKHDFYFDEQVRLTTACTHFHGVIECEFAEHPKNGGPSLSLASAWFPVGALLSYSVLLRLPSAPEADPHSVTLYCHADAQGRIAASATMACQRRNHRLFSRF